MARHLEWKAMWATNVPSPSYWHLVLHVDLFTVSEQHITEMSHTRGQVCSMSMERLPQYEFHKWMKFKQVWAPYGHKNRGLGHILRKIWICVPDTCNPKQNFSDTWHQSWHQLDPSTKVCHENWQVPPSTKLKLGLSGSMVHWRTTETMAIPATPCKSQLSFQTNSLPTPSLRLS